MSRRTSRSSRRRTSRSMIRNVLLLPNASAEFSKRLAAAQKATQGMTSEEIASHLKRARRDYTRLLLKIGDLRRSAAIGDPSEKKLLSALRSQLEDRAQEIQDLMLASGQGEAYQAYITSPGGARGLPSSAFKAWSMKPNVLLLPNPEDWSPLAKLKMRQLAEARRRLNDIGLEFARGGDVTRDDIRKQQKLVQDAEYEVLKAQERSYAMGYPGPSRESQQTAPLSKKERQDIAAKRAARLNLPSAAFLSWSTGRLRKNGMEPNVLLLPNGSVSYDPEWLYQSADAAYHQLARAFDSLQAASRRKHIEEDRSTCNWYMGRLVAFLEVLDRDFSDPATSPLSSDQLYKIEYMKASLGAIRNALRSMSGISVTPGGGWDRSGY